VLLHSLSSRQEFNGSEGLVVDFDSQTQRHRVALRTGQVLSVSSGNMSQLCPCTSVDGRREGRIAGFSPVPHPGRYMVTWSGGTTEPVSPAEVTVHMGTVGHIEHLASEPALNGSWAKLQGVDIVARRYEVIHFASGRTLRVKLENFVV